jgi:hypothetical protein
MESKDIQAELERELKALMEKLGISGLQVLWSPDETSKLSGEVRGSVIHIYEPNLEKARETLKHEVLDYLVSNPIEPYKEMTNMFIRKVNEEAYCRKERVVQSLLGLIKNSGKEPFKDKASKSGSTPSSES